MCLVLLSMPYPTKPKGGWQRPWQVVVNKSTAQLREKKAALKFSNKYKDIFEKAQTMADGHSSQQLGPYFNQEGGKMYASLPIEMLQGIQQSPLFKQMKKVCAAKGIELPKDIMAKDPRAHVLTPQQYLKNVEAGTMPPFSTQNKNFTQGSKYNEGSEIASACGKKFVGDCLVVCRYCNDKPLTRTNVGYHH